MLRFVRQKSFSCLCEKPPSLKRGFFFALAVGFVRPLDPLTGMSASLPEMDQALDRFTAAHGRSESPGLLFREAQVFFTAAAAAQGAELSCLSLREERNWSLNWDRVREPDFSQLRYECSHFFESLHPDSAGLWRIACEWRRTAEDSFVDGCELSAASLRFLKASGLDSLTPMEQNAKTWQSLIGTSFCAENRGVDSILTRIRIESKDPAYALILE